MGDSPVIIPSARDVRGTLDGPDDARTVVVACPPHPQYGGTRSDPRLVAVADAFADRHIACLRFDYGPWDGGPGEVTDAVAAIRWAGERFDAIAVFGYSFGGGVALCAARDAAGTDRRVSAVSILAPVARLGEACDAVVALSILADRAIPIQVVYGTRDSSADWESVVEQARSHDCALVAFESDHFFLTNHDRVAAAVTDFLSSHL